MEVLTTRLRKCNSGIRTNCGGNWPLKIILTDSENPVTGTISPFSTALVKPSLASIMSLYWPVIKMRTTKPIRTKPNCTNLGFFFK